MCAICGVYYFDRARHVVEADVTAMRETMVHRGPDGFGNFVRGHVGLGHRRLSIVDLTGGAQPMCNEDGTVWVIFNGEIYNHRDLRPRLESRGHVFRTSSDTEAIVHLYEDEGEAGFARMNGMFAIAVYDARRERLVLVRDRMGVKPLYYRATREELVFGSEIKAILAHPGTPAAVNYDRVPELLLYGSVYGRETAFRGIEELEPGHLLVADAGGVSVRRWWDLPAEPADEADEPTQRAQVRDLLRLSVQRRLMSDVPLGAFLSGGVDSSLIVAMMAELVGGGVRTFSIGFGEPGYDEFRYSREVARRFRTDHTEVTLDASRFFDALPQLVWYYDEPVALPASVPLYFLSRETKGKATVILTGEGSDELLLGYDKYAWARKHARRAATFQRACPAFAREAVVGIVRRLLGPERRLLDRLPMRPGEVAASFYHEAPPALVDALRDRGGPVPPRDPARDACAATFERAPAGRDFLARMEYMDFKTFLVTLLMKQDKMSMAASIESRVPFLDYELVEYGYRIPTAHKIQGDVHKKILKDIAAEYLPSELVHRPKQGFPVPITPWFLAPATRRRYEEVLLDPGTTARGIFCKDVVEAHLRRIASGTAGETSDATMLVWNLLNFELWQRTFTDRKPAMPTATPILGTRPGEQRRLG